MITKQKCKEMEIISENIKNERKMKGQCYEIGSSEGTDGGNAVSKK